MFLFLNKKWSPSSKATAAAAASQCAFLMCLRLWICECRMRCGLVTINADSMQHKSPSPVCLSHLHVYRTYCLRLHSSETQEGCSLFQLSFCLVPLSQWLCFGYSFVSYFFFQHFISVFFSSFFEPENKIELNTKIQSNTSYAFVSRDMFFFFFFFRLRFTIVCTREPAAHVSGPFANE